MAIFDWATEEELKDCPLGDALDDVASLTREELVTAYEALSGRVTRLVELLDETTRFLDPEWLPDADLLERIRQEIGS